MKPGFSPWEIYDVTGERTQLPCLFTSPEGNIFEYTIDNAGKVDESAEAALAKMERAKEANALQGTIYDAIVPNSLSLFF